MTIDGARDVDRPRSGLGTFNADTGGTAGAFLLPNDPRFAIPNPNRFLGAGGRGRSSCILGRMLGARGEGVRRCGCGIGWGDGVRGRDGARVGEVVLG